jgi:hypothetical protein
MALRFVDTKPEPARLTVSRKPVSKPLVVTKPPVTKPLATNVATNKPVATNANPARTANRRTPEAFREYQRAYMAKRRAAAKVTDRPADRASLATVDIADSPA